MRVVLVVDDDPDVRSSLTECLADAGYSVADAANVADALRRLRALKPRLVLMEQRVPSFTYGKEFLRNKAADPEVASIPVVVMTAYLEFPDVDGVVEFLAEPFSIDDLLAVVERFAGPPHGPAAAA